jgi:hypothetical protein
LELAVWEDSSSGVWIKVAEAVGDDGEECVRIASMPKFGTTTVKYGQN